MFSKLFASLLFPPWNWGVLEILYWTLANRLRNRIGKNRGRMLQHASWIFSLGILNFVWPERLAGGEGDNLSTFAPREGRLAGRKPVFCKCLLGRVYTRLKRLFGVHRTPQGRVLPLRLHGPLSGHTGQAGRHSLCRQLVLQDRNCKAWLLAMKNYPGRRFLSYEMHLLITLQKSSLPLLVLPSLSFSVPPLTSLQAFRNVSMQGCWAVPALLPFLKCAVSIRGKETPTPISASQYRCKWFKLYWGLSDRILANLRSIFMARVLVYYSLVHCLVVLLTYKMVKWMVEWSSLQVFSRVHKSREVCTSLTLLFLYFQHCSPVSGVITRKKE